MIRVRFLCGPRGGLRGLEAKGHAGYAEEGEPDIICAAVTALCATAVGAAQDLLGLEVSYKMEEGDLGLEVQSQDLSPRQEEDLNLLLCSVRLGCEQIALSYGKQFLDVEAPAKTEGGSRNDFS